MSSRLCVESSRKYPSSSFNLTVEEVDRLTTQVLAELSQGQKPDIQEEGKQNGAGDVRAGVIRHTSKPNQPLAYYYLRK